jgi:large repetitive protein
MLAGDNEENDASINLAYQITDQDDDSSAAPGTLNVLFDDDTPTVTPDVITVTQGAENTAFDFTLVEGTHFFEGADGVDLASGVTFTDATYGTITYDGAGTFTYTPASGAGSDGATSDSFTFTVTDADGDSVTKTVNVTLQPDSVPMAGTPTSLAVDEDGLTGANADDGQTDPAEVTGTNSASDLSGSVVVDYGNDVPADLLGSVVLVDDPAYDTQIRTLDGNFVTFALELNTATMRDDLVGRSVGGDEVIRIAITGATAGPNPGEVTYTYAATLSLPIQHGTAGTEDTETLAGVTLRFTDGDDSDTTTASFDVTVRDDVPSLDVTAGAESGVVLTTQDAETDGDPTDSDSASSTVGMVSAGFGGVFGLTFQKGADDGPTPVLTYVLDLKADGGLSGLESAGAPIYLYQLDDQTVVGSTAATNPGSIDATAVFSVSVAADGTVTLVQYQQVDHPLADDPDASDAPFDDQFASLADDLITLTARSSLTDGDGDTATDSETIDIGANLRFADDGPSLSGAVTANAGVTIDETTAGPPAGFGTGIVATSTGAAITFAEAFGADGPAVGGGLAYSIEITGASGTSPFVTAVGDYPVTLVEIDADTIEGRYTDSAMVEQTAFRLDIGSDGGLTLTQFVALEHVQDGDTAADYDDALYLTADGTAGGASLVSARITVTDFDGDTATGAAAIGANVVFRDDGVDAVLDTGSVAAGSNAAIMGNVLANDYRGADGSSITAVSNTDAGTTGTLAGDEITIQGEYGVLVVNVNTGAYTYTRDPGEGGGEQDVFSYTLTDSDGDFDAATLTISIGNLTPVAGTAQATVDDDGLANGNPGGTGDIDANTPAGRTADLDQTSTEAVFKGVLGGTLGDGTNTFTFLAAQTATTVGQETVSYTVSPDGALLTATIASSPDTGRVGQVLFTATITDQTTGAYTLTLERPVLHATLDMLAGDNEENDASINLAYQITDQDDDSSAAPGTLNVLFDDDTPSAVVTQNAVVTNATGSGTFALDTAGVVNNLVADNYGADGPGSVRFSTDTSIYPNLQSNGVPITYMVSMDQLTLTAKAGATTVFTVTLDPAAATPSYSVQMFATVDSITTINFNDGSYDFLGGNDPWAGFVPVGQNPNRPGGVPIDDNSSDLLLTPFGATGSAINGTANSAGVTGGGAGQNIGTGEGIRLDYVSDLRGNPAGTPANYQGNPAQQDHVFDNHVPTNNASVRFGDGNGNTTISIRVYNVTDVNNGPAPDIVLGQGVLSNISAISVSFDGDVKIFTYPGMVGSQTQLVGTPGSGLADRNYTVEWVSESGTIYARVTGVLDTNVSIATTGTTTYNALEILYISGSDFELTGFGSASVTNTPVSFALPIEVVDADGDVAASFLDLTMRPATGTINGSGVIAATTDNPNVIGSDGNDTITGTSANNVIVGGKGGDTLTGNGGSDVFVIDPSHITAVNDDTITDYNAGDIVDLQALIGSFGANGAMSAAQATQTIRLFGNALQVDDNGTAPGTSWVTIATLSNNPIAVTILYDFSENPVTLNRISPPVVLDLDGDGVEFSAVAAGTSYDFGGGLVGTAWFGQDDGLLVFDADGNARVDGAFEFEFGSDGLTDLEALAAKYGDVLDANDADFGKFGVWQDANGNGVSDAGEFYTLDGLGIVSLSLISDGVAYTAANGDVSVAGSSTFTRADGSTGALADAAFATAVKSAQRTAEIVTTAALAGAALNALPVAAQPAMAEGPQTDALPTLETGSPESAGLAIAEPGADEGRGALADFVSQEPAEAGGSSQHISGETSEAHFIANDTAFDDAGQAPAWLAAAAGVQAGQGANALFTGMGAEGTMQALLSIAPQAASADGASAGTALAVLDSALSDFRGEVLVEGIVDHFAAAGHQGPIEESATAFADAGPFMLMQGIGGAGADFAAMINLPDAHDDASMLAAAQA